MIINDGNTTINNNNNTNHINNNKNNDNANSKGSNTTSNTHNIIHTSTHQSTLIPGCTAADWPARRFDSAAPVAYNIISYDLT